jgi:hypothetical protein
MWDADLQTGCEMRDSGSKEPLACVVEAGEDYSHVDARYGLREATANPEMLQPSQWSLLGRHPPRPALVTGVIIRLRFTPHHVASNLARAISTSES